MKILSLIAAASLTAISARAQVLDSTIYLTDASTGGVHGHLSASPDQVSGSVLTWRRRSTASSPAQATSISLPMNRPWGARQAGPTTYLVVGADVDLSVSPHTTDAVLVAVQLDAVTSSITVLGSTSYAGHDFRSVYFNSAEQLCYVIDDVASGLMVAPWTVGGPLPPGFVLVVDAATAPFVHGNWLPFLAASDAGPGVSIRAYDSGDYFGDIVGYTVHYAGAAWIVEPELRLGAGTDIPQWNFGSYFQNTRANSVSVAGVVGPFAIALAGGQDVETGVTTSDEVTVVPVGPGVLLPGASYVIRGLTSSAATSPILPINSSWGQPCPGPSIDVVRGLVADCYIGNSSFRATSQIHWRTESALVETRDLFLVVGFAIPGAEGVTVNQSGCATMDSIAAVIGPIATKINGSSPGLASVDLPVPADSGLAGLHVLLQWVASDGAELALSEVHGSLVFPAPALAASTLGGGALVPGSAAALQALQCAASWCDSRPEMAWNHAKRELRKKLKHL